MPETKTANVKSDKILIELSPSDAFLFEQFQKRYDVIGQLVGYMEAVKIFDLKNMSIQMDIDNLGIVKHTSITRHFRI